MRERKGQDEGVGAGYRYVSLGYTFAGGILLFMGAGYALDRWLGTLPWLTLAGTLAGAVLSFLSVYRRLMADEAREKRERAGK
ncbi:MAG TPA: AtpZ/AtpI family protein [Gemmatimonadales bacterium]|nr:AtpZ/AtpI family protein [Gemmatimonadales bacterium]